MRKIDTVGDVKAANLFCDAEVSWIDKVWAQRVCGACDDVGWRATVVAQQPNARSVAGGCNISFSGLGAVARA